MADRIPRRRRERTTGDYVFAAIFNLFVVLALNAHAVWRPWTHGVVTADFPLTLWAVNLAGAVQVAGNLVLAFARPLTLLRWVDVFFAMVSLNSVVVFLTVFPLEFSQVAGAWMNALARAVLALGVLGAGIAVVVNVVRLLVGGGPRQSLQH